MTPRRRCIDCPPTGRRKAPHPGPRCATHHKQVTAQRRAGAWARRLWDLYRLTVDQYERIYKKQGGCCFICRRAKGIRKRLAVDHDHACCPTTPTCGKCTRGLLCGTCNRRVVGHLRDDPAAFRRGADYLENPPAKGIV